MDLSESAEHEKLRADVRAFLAANWSSAGSGDARAFRRRATDAGFLYRSMPRAYGGSEQPWDPVAAAIVAEEFANVGAPMEVRGVGVQMLAPTLLEWGAEWQKERFIRKTLQGDYRWCQGYSEPDAGSDLASLRTRAELCGGNWVINGQKVWTSHAREAHYMFALVRTDPDAPKYRNLSYLLIDMNQPGIEVRPLKQINGDQSFNEVFFTDATTPADWIVGRPGEGWNVSRSLLKHERNMLGGIDRSQAMFNSLIKLARRVDSGPAKSIDDRAVRVRLASLLAQLEVQRYATYIQQTREISGEGAGSLQVFNKLAQSNYAASIAQTALDLVRNEALLAPKLENGDQGNERWMNQYMNSLAAAIAGGASNIQRNLIAERVLGLPRDRTGEDRS